MNNAVTRFFKHTSTSFFGHLFYRFTTVFAIIPETSAIHANVRRTNRYKTGVLAGKLMYLIPTLSLTDTTNTKINRHLRLLYSLREVIFSAYWLSFMITLLIRSCGPPIMRKNLYDSIIIVTAKSNSAIYSWFVNFFIEIAHYKIGSAAIIVNDQVVSSGADISGTFDDAQIIKECSFKSRFITGRCSETEKGLISNRATIEILDARQLYRLIALYRKSPNIKPQATRQVTIISERNINFKSSKSQTNEKK